VDHRGVKLFEFRWILIQSALEEAAAVAAKEDADEPDARVSDGVESSPKRGSTSSTGSRRASDGGSGIDGILSQTIFNALDSAGDGTLLVTEFVPAVSLYIATVSCTTVRTLLQQWFDVFNSSASDVSMSSSDMAVVMKILSRMKVLGKQEVRDLLGSLFPCTADGGSADNGGSNIGGGGSGGGGGGAISSRMTTRALSTGSNAEDADTITKVQFVEVLEGMWGRIKCVEGFNAWCSLSPPPPPSLCTLSNHICSCR
jgi:hypothetical protein